jgi:hypothetical protein
MNAAERLEAEEQSREREQRRKAAEHRRAMPELVFKTTTQDARVSSTPVVVPPKVAPNETAIWWQWVGERIAAQSSKLESDIDSRFAASTEAVGEALGKKVSRPTRRLAARHQIELQLQLFAHDTGEEAAHRTLLPARFLHYRGDAAPASDKKRIAAEAFSAFQKAVTDQGLSLDEYISILEVAQNDPEVGDKIRQRLPISPN